MTNMFLVQMLYYDDDEIYSSLKTAYEIIDIVNSMDYLPIESIRVFDISSFGDIKELNYKGWQPNCLIQFVDDEGNLVISGYGEDH